MKHINWNTEKSLKLKESRNICFEDIVYYIEKGLLLDDYLHPNQKRYSGQRVMVIGINNYAYLVPYVEDGNEIFLKTIIPSRKATEIYLGERNENS
ncbi:MAG: BrnT family toxin [Candidatus Firestonebacteria bacterium]|nr:BrnT family toxin [Candidatus Firestonebacteria bacterium]